MNPDTTIQAFVDSLHPSLLFGAKEKALCALDDADALREEAELSLKETQFAYPDLVPLASSVRVLVARAAESAAEALLHAIQARITSLRLEGKAPAPETFTSSNISTHVAL